ncbi:MAG: hypothetical protein O7A63_04430 [Acidobacteria bacterium]|nr:hypothetical protein [Acidobacteriota bacterium]
MARGWTFGRIVIVILVVLTVVLAGAGWYFWSKHLDPLLQGVRAQRAHGLEFGQSADARECLMKAFEIYAEEPGIKRGMICRIFLDSCLSMSSPSAGFCGGVPATNEVVASAKWRVSVCGREGHGDESCHMLLDPLQEYCEGVGGGAYDGSGADGGDLLEGSEPGAEDGEAPEPDGSGADQESETGSGDEKVSGTDGAEAADGVEAADGAADPDGEGS